MQREDWTLLALSKAYPKPLSPVQLQKSLFLLGTELSEVVGHDFYVFEAYHYGPFDKDIYSDADGLASDGFVTVSQSPRGWREYSATVEGVSRAHKLEKKLLPAAVAYLGEVVRWAQKQSFQSLVRNIYARYPSYRRNSVFRG